jgi:hypothetical protein
MPGLPMASDQKDQGLKPKPAAATEEPTAAARDAASKDLEKAKRTA